jgi:VanZ family protein
MSRKPVLIVACLLLAFITFATLSPIHLRPKTGHPNLERCAAFLLLGAAYTLALPRRAGPIAVCMVVCAFVLEGAQYFAPTRDPDLRDALVKAFGGLLGVAIACVVEVGLARRRSDRNRSERQA